MPFGNLTLSLGPVVFDEYTMEVPSRISDLGGSQAVVTHRFPGGGQTQQTFGAFPPDEIRWRGLFTGNMAMHRKNTVDRLRASGQEVALVYGDKTFLGVVREVKIEPRHQWLIDYEISFVPRIDMSGGAGPSLLSVIFDLVNNILQVLNNLMAFFGLITAPSQAFPTPPQLYGPVETMFSVTSAAMSVSYGIVQNIPPSTAAAIYAAAEALLAAALPLTQSADPTVSSPALDLSAYASSIAVLVGAPNSTVTTLQVLNPNLHSIAAQYYGDASKWLSIAQASNLNPLDPMPIGHYTLTVPAQ